MAFTVTPAFVERRRISNEFKHEYIRNGGLFISLSFYLLARRREQLTVPSPTFIPGHGKAYSDQPPRKVMTVLTVGQVQQVAFRSPSVPSSFLTYDLTIPRRPCATIPQPYFTFMDRRGWVYRRSKDVRLVIGISLLAFLYLAFCFWLFLLYSFFFFFFVGSSWAIVHVPSSRVAPDAE